MGKSFIKIILKGLILIVLLFLIIHAMEPLFTESEKSVWTDFYDQDKDGVDILVLGNSHANAGLKKSIIEANLNANVISLATRGQNIYQTYYCALEAYKYQTPKVLIIENFLFYERLTREEFVEQDPTINDYLKRYLTFEGKKIGEVKLMESKDFFNGSIVENMFPAIKKHDQWTNYDKIRKRIYEHNIKEGNTGITVMDQQKVEAYKSQTTFGLDKYNILPDEYEALKQIIELAKKNGTEQIILLTIPFYKGYRDKIDYNSLRDPLLKFAQENPNVKYVDLNSNFQTWDNTYFSNDPVGYNQHLNYKGAIKVSNYLSSILKSDVNPYPNRIPKKSIEYYLYNNIKKETTLSGKSLLGNLENLSGSKELLVTLGQGKSSLVLEGWMAIDGVKSENQEMYLGFVKDDSFIYISSSYQFKPKLRKDVTKYFKKQNELYDHSGFIVNINTNLLEKGVYGIYMIMKVEDDVIVKKSFKSVEIN